MGIKDKALAFSRKFKLDSHHAIERFGVFFGIFAVTGAIVITGSGAAALKAGNDALTQTALYTTKFKTSKTNLDGTVDGVYTNKSDSKALVMMHFDTSAQISYSAADYRAFLLGSDTSLNSEPVSTSGVKGSFHVFGSTGYVGVLLEADRSFNRQVLNLTVRATAELTTPGPERANSPDKLAKRRDLLQVRPVAGLLQPRCVWGQEDRGARRPDLRPGAGLLRGRAQGGGDRGQERPGPETRRDACESDADSVVHE